MSEFDPIRHVEDQRRDWNRVAPAWEKWDAWLESGFRVTSDFLIREARISAGHHILDVGSGTGHPAIPAAQIVGPSGSVIGIDVSERMLEVSRRKAEALGVNNVSFRRAEVDSLGFDDNHFDAVISRYCLMFLPYLGQTLREIARVLKPGGGVAVLVWAVKEKNPYITLAANVLKNYIEIPPPDPSLPGIFYLATPGDLLSRMKQAGFDRLNEAEVQIEGAFESGEEYLQCLKEMAAPMHGLFAALPANQKPHAEKDIIGQAEQFRRDGKVRIPGVALAVSGVKPS